MAGWLAAVLACRLLTQNPLIHNEPEEICYTPQDVGGSVGEAIVTSCAAATDVGMHGLLASQSCYHSVLPPCLSTLLTSSRFLHC